MTTFREASKKDYSSDSTIKDIEIGTLQRIADACEIMAKNYQQLIDDRNYYKKGYIEREEQIIHLQNQNRGLKSVITRMRK